MADKSEIVEEANSTFLTFGKHAGKTVLEVFNKHKNYVAWALAAKNPSPNLAEVVDIFKGLNLCDHAGMNKTAKNNQPQVTNFGPDIDESLELCFWGDAAVFKVLSFDSYKEEYLPNS